jgi:hypothetical protein
MHEVVLNLVYGDTSPEPHKAAKERHRRHSKWQIL